MKLWVDDRRPVPDDSWTLARDVEEAIRYLETGEVEELALDNDLGIGRLEREGSAVADWLEEQVAEGRLVAPLVMRCISSNPSARLRIEATFDSIRRLDEERGA